MKDDKRFGGLVLTVKPEEANLWRRYCERAGRLDDLVMFGPGHPHVFNFLEYELNRPGPGGGHTENIVNLFDAVTEISQRGQKNGGREDAGYWRNACRQLSRNSVDLLTLSTGTLSVPFLYELITDIAQSPEEAASERWQQDSAVAMAIRTGRARDLTDRQRHDFQLATTYFMKELPALSEKTRSVVLSTFVGIIDPLNRGALKDLFSGTSTLTPDAPHEGKIVVIDMPVKEYHELGQFSQVIWKFLFQRETERRGGGRPVFIWADEAQHFITSHDMMFQATARSSRCATVYLTQNISNYYAMLGSEEAGKAYVDSLMGNFQTKIFHANADAVTNNWAAEAIGKGIQRLASSNISNPNSFIRDPSRVSFGMSEHYEYLVQPSDFTMLRKGGPRHDMLVDAVVFQGGRVWNETGDTSMLVTFDQKAEGVRL